MATAFRRIQAGRETTIGTEVNADKIMLGTLTVSPTLTLHQPMDERNSLAQYYRTVPVAHQSTMRYTSDVTYEQVLDFLSMTLCAEATAASGARTRYTFTPSTSGNAQKGYTFEYGDNTEQFTMAGVQCTSLEIGMNMGGALTLNADMFGKFPVAKAAATGISNPAVKTVITDTGKFFLDANWGAKTSTQKGNAAGEIILAGGSVRLNSGLAPSRRLSTGSTDGVFNYTHVVESKRSHSMDLDILVTSEWEADIWDAFRNQTPKVVSLQFTAETDSIESSKSHDITINMYGHFTSMGEIYSDQDGDSMVRMTLTSYDDGSGNEVEVIVDAKTSEVGTL